MVKRLGRLLTAEQYIVCVAPPNGVAQAPRTDVTMIALTSANLDLTESSRPGYRAIASNYLESGHLGWVALTPDGVAGCCWMFVNDTPRTTRAKGYFRVPPHSAYLHAAWVDPNHRGQGIHRHMVSFRAGLSPYPLLANIATTNTASLRAYASSGFRQAVTFTLLSAFGRVAATPHASRLSRWLDHQRRNDFQ